jgi:hypothetical protein
MPIKDFIKNPGNKLAVFIWNDPKFAFHVVIPFGKNVIFCFLP